MRRFLLVSHDGFGLGHVRRNALLADALQVLDPGAAVTVVTGIRHRMRWLERPGVRVVRVPPLLKDPDGAYRSAGMPFETALAVREAAFRAEVAAGPDVVVVDRHPYGTGGELRAGLVDARRRGAAIVLGLRDVLDAPEVVRAEIAGRGWDGVDGLFDRVLVYGSPAVCDHEAEYGLPLAPTYCGWVADRVPAPRAADPLLAVAAGGGGDGADVFRLGTGVLRLRPGWHGVVAAGPYARPELLRLLAGDPRLAGRLRLTRPRAGCARLFAEAGAAIQMAGYNSTFEALAAGLRPILVPRRSPRREQAIRATRLAALGVADMVDAEADAAEAAWLLDQPRRLAPDALARAGIDLDGAGRAGELLHALAGERLR